jgi:hypothetical protein
MEVKDLKPGIYTLAADVYNPKRDKRVTRDWRHAEIFRKGLKIRAVEITFEKDFPSSLELQPWGNYAFQSLNMEDPRTIALALNLEVNTDVVDTLDERIRNEYYSNLSNSAEEVLEEILRTGEISSDRVFEIIKNKYDSYK